VGGTPGRDIKGKVILIFQSDLDTKTQFLIFYNFIGLDFDCFNHSVRFGFTFFWFDGSITVTLQAMDGDPAVEPQLDSFSLTFPLPYRVAFIVVLGMCCKYSCE